MIDPRAAAAASPLSPASQADLAEHRPTGRGLRVLHSYPVWLPQTMTWLYSQVADAQKLGVDSHVACQYVERIDQFRVDNIHAALDAPPAARQGWAHKLADWRVRTSMRLVHSHIGNIIDRQIGGARERDHARHLRQVCDAIDPDIVHSHFGDVAWENMHLLKGVRARHMVTFYGFDVNKLPRSPVWRRRYLELFAHADRVLCEGSHMMRSLIALGCPPHKARVQHLGVDIAGIPFTPRQWQPGEPLKVLIAASFREKKGIPYAVEALGVLQHRVPLELTIIGDAGPEPDARRQKRQILAELSRSGLTAKTRLLGYQPHARMLAEARQHHVFLHPSVTARDGDSEGGAPVCISEMLASGMPVISTQHCDIPEVMGPQLAHLLAPERNSAALVNRLESLLNQHARWSEWARAGRHRIETEYQRQEQAVRLREHHREVARATP